MNASKPCKDCVADGVATQRPTPHPGPRCVTHHRAKRKADKLRAHALRIEANFEISGEDYWAIYESQDGLCAICRKARGLARRLAVDHDHRCTAGHPPEQGCPLCVRALLCSRCNQMIGWLDPEALVRAIWVLTEAPARKFLAERAAPAQ